MCTLLVNTDKIHSFFIVFSLALGAAGYNSNKLVLYGDFEEVFPWLLRRLDENKDMLGAAQLELPLIHNELKRRMQLVAP